MAVVVRWSLGPVLLLHPSPTSQKTRPHDQQPFFPRSQNQNRHSRNLHSHVACLTLTVNSTCSFIPPPPPPAAALFPPPPAPPAAFALPPLAAMVSLVASFGFYGETRRDTVVGFEMTFSREQRRTHLSYVRTFTAGMPATMPCRVAETLYRYLARGEMRSEDRDHNIKHWKMTGKCREEYER